MQSSIYQYVLRLSFELSWKFEFGDDVEENFLFSRKTETKGSLTQMQIF